MGLFMEHDNPLCHKNETNERLWVTAMTIDVHMSTAAFFITASSEAVTSVTGHMFTCHVTSLISSGDIHQIIYRFAIETCDKFFIPPALPTQNHSLFPFFCPSGLRSFYVASCRHDFATFTDRLYPTYSGTARDHCAAQNGSTTFWHDRCDYEQSRGLGARPNYSWSPGTLHCFVSDHAGTGHGTVTWESATLQPTSLEHPTSSRSSPLIIDISDLLCSMCSFNFRFSLCLLAYPRPVRKRGVTAHFNVSCSKAWRFKVDIHMASQCFGRSYINSLYIYYIYRYTYVSQPSNESVNPDFIPRL